MPKGDHAVLFNTRWKGLRASLTLLSLLAIAVAGSAGSRWGG
jgi:hypothetical protein